MAEHEDEDEKWLGASGEPPIRLQAAMLARELRSDSIKPYIRPPGIPVHHHAIVQADATAGAEISAE